MRGAWLAIEPPLRSARSGLAAYTESRQCAIHIRRVQKFTSRKAAAARIWAAIQPLVTDGARRGPREGIRELVPALLRRLQSNQQRERKIH